MDTDAVIAAFLETSLPTYQRWKSGRKTPDTDALIRIVEKLNLSARWLLLGTGDPDDAPLPMAAAPEGMPVPVMNARILALEAELHRREKELLETKTEIIDLQRKLLERQ